MFSVIAALGLRWPSSYFCEEEKEGEGKEKRKPELSGLNFPSDGRKIRNFLKLGPRVFAALFSHAAMVASSATSIHSYKSHVQREWLRERELKNKTKGLELERANLRA